MILGKTKMIIYLKNKLFIINIPYHCAPCQIDCQSQSTYDVHLQTEKHRCRIANIEYDKNIQTIKDLSRTIEDLSKTIEELSRKNEDLIKKNEEFKITFEKQKESYECQLDNKDKAQMKRIIAEANLITKCAVLEETNEKLTRIAEKPVNITNNNTNYKTINKILNVISPEVIDYSQIHKYLTAEVASNGPEAVANAVHNNLLMDSNGNPKVICTDPSRNKFKIKDPNTGDLIDDINLEAVKLGIRDQIEFKQMKKDAHIVARLKVTKDETPEVLALSYMKSMRLNGETGRKLKNLAKQHYISTAKVKLGGVEK